MKKLGTTLLSVLLASCGGGAGVDFGDLGGGSSGGAYVYLNSFNLSSRSFTTGSTFKVSWNVSYGSSIGHYWVDFFVAQTDTRDFNGASKVFTYLGGSGTSINRGCPTGSCTATCNVTRNIAGDIYISCTPDWTSDTPQSIALNFTGSGYAIMRACTSDFTSKCDVKSMPITVGP